MEQLTPRQIVSQLDKYIIGQKKAKRAVAVALRNRWRRQQVDPELRDEIAPKNIIMIGSTGVGKTEIARRLARLAQAPFLKIEASKFTEVGYVGRDVESMIRDLTEVSVKLVKEEETRKVRKRAEEQAEERILDILLRGLPEAPETPDAGDASQRSTREKFRRRLHEGKLDDREIEIEMPDRRTIPMVEIFSSSGIEEMDINLRDMFGNIFPKRKKQRKVKVAEARRLLTEEEAQKLIDMEKVVQLAIERVENSGIIFLDEIDKIAGRESRHGPDVSREGVQRDLLPIVEGSTVSTKYGLVQTDHILFIAAGAFHVAKPTDLIPELQGRFPIRVELDPLSREDFIRILTEPENAIIKQYVALLATEGVTLDFTESAIERIADLAQQFNEQMENIGARRLHTVLERLLEEVSFEAPDLAGQKVTITADYVEERLAPLLEDQDLSRYIL